MSTRSKQAEFIALCEPYVGGREWEYVKRCLDEGWVSSVGAFVERFERDFAAYVGGKHAVAVASGTAALHVALLVAGVEPDDEVLVSDVTFIASANAIHYAGAHPVFMDADPLTWQMDVRKVADFLEQECQLDGEVLRNRSTGRRVRAIMPVHILGHAVEMTPLRELAERFGLRIVDDATESVGAQYRGRAAGAWGDIAAYSFNGNKIMTTGSGGMIVTDDPAWARKAKYLTTQAKDDPLEYVHEEIGYNYRLSNLQAAMGCAQLEQIEAFIAKKRQIAARYDAAFEHLEGIAPLGEAPDTFSTFWMYTVRVDPDGYGSDSRALLRRLQAEQIQTRPLWRPMHLLTPYRDAQAYRIEFAETLYHEALSLPCSVGLSEAEQERVIAAICARV